MKILIVCNLYPPHYIGGYELRCAQVAEYLRAAGHAVCVITSSYLLPGNHNDPVLNQDEQTNEILIKRCLYHYKRNPRLGGPSYTFALAKQQLADVRQFIQILNEFQPDIVNWWNCEGLTKALLSVPLGRRIPNVYWIEDDWLLSEYGAGGEKDRLCWFDFWRGQWGPWFMRPLLRRALLPWRKKVQREGIPTHLLPHQPDFVCFVSEFLRFQHESAGLTFPAAEMIHGGVAVERFYIVRERFTFFKEKVRLLYAGQMTRSRGLHTIIEALGILPPDVRKAVDLSIASSHLAQSDSYVTFIKTRIAQLGLSEGVRFLGRVLHAEMPHVYRTHDLVISASMRGEGLPLNMVEAMCAGCAVITTGSGGASEIAERADLPLFPQDHPVALSRLLTKLVNDRELLRHVAQRGQETAVREFDFSRMAERLCQIFHLLSKKKTRTLCEHVSTTTELLGNCEGEIRRDGAFLK